MSSRPTASSASSARSWGLEPPGPGAPAWTTSAWLNAAEPLTLAALRGRVVVLHAFQMLCPACVQHALPQAQRIQRIFGDAGVAVLGLHTVFEHHEAMTPVALAAFLHEYRIGFPVGIDAPSATLADALTKVMFISGPRQIEALARKWRVDVLWVEKTGRWHATSGIRLV